MEHQSLRLSTAKQGIIIFSIVISALFSINDATGQTTVTVGTGTTTSVNIPLTTYYGYTYSQNIYLGSEITAASGFPGMISKIRFYYNNGPTGNSDSWTIYMGNTSRTSFGSDTDWEPVGNLTQVFSGTVTFPSSAGWMEITLTAPFNYSGGNIIVALDENTPGYSSSNSSWNYTQTIEQRAIYYRNDSNNPDPSNPPTATGRVTGYSNIQFDITPFPPCSGTPAPGNTTASVSNVCSGSSTAVTLGLQNSYETSSQIQYQWQVFNGTSWDDLAGDTSATLQVSGLTANTQYQCAVTCIANGTGTSTPVTINVSPQPNVTVTPTEYVICSSGSAGLTAGGADTYSWSPSTGLSGTTGNLVTANPGVSTQYTVVGTDVNGCTATATALISPIADLNVNTTYTPSPLCTPGIPVTMDVVALPTGISGSGTWEYQWTDTSGNNVLQPWGATSQFSTNPPIAGVYMYKLFVRSTSCPSELPEAKLTSFTVGFGADVDAHYVNCHFPTGTITLNNVFGQSSIDTLHHNDFTSSTLAGNEALYGIASITGGRCVITPSATSNKGGYSVTNPLGLGGTDTYYRISFNLTADMPINTYGTGGADGICYSFGNDAVYSSSGSQANGYGSKLRISFDAADNSTDNGNIKGIYLTYGYSSTTAMGPASPGVLAYSNNMNWKIATDTPVEIIINTQGQLTLTVGSTIIFNQVQLPASYLSEDRSGWHHLFSAHTGGDAMRQAIDNIIIENSSLSFGLAPGNSGNVPSSWQESNVFTGLTSGSYDVWISNPEDANCNGFIGTYDVSDLNPVADLGNDTMICQGNFITLDAGNVTSTYLWSNDSTTQTILVDAAGSYWVQVTDTVGCTDIDAVSIDFAPAPSVNGIIATGTNIYYTFSADYPQNCTHYFWDFGDGNTDNGTSSTVNHNYASFGNYTVTLIVSNDYGCTEDTVTINLLVADNAGVEEENTSTVTVYPNPSHDYVMISSASGTMIHNLNVYDVAGKMIYAGNGINAVNQTLNISGWNAGIYMIHVYTEAGETVHRLIVAH